MKKIFSILLLFLAYYFSFAQITGGNTSYSFLHLPPSARIGALGGTQIAIQDEDLSIAFQNPAMLNRKMDKQMSLNGTLYFAGIKYGYAGYSDHFGFDTANKNITRFSAGIQYINYGKFKAADSIGNIVGEFDADEYVMHFALAKQEGRWSYGGNLKFIYSALEQYYSSAVALDLATAYIDTSRRFIAALVFKNIGRPIKNFSKDNYEKLPFDIQLGLTKKLKHMPLQFSLTVHHLQKFNIRYDNPDDDESISLFSKDSVKKDKKYTLDKIARHLIIGGEFTIAKIIRLDIAYNHLRRQELRMTTKSGLAGFSFGLGLKINRFVIHYGRAIYHIAGATNHFSMNMNVAGFFRKKPVNVME